jgi:hypothetical protein
MALWPNTGHGLLILEVSRSHSTTHYSRYDSSVGVIGPTQWSVPDNTKHSKETEIQASGKILSRSPSKRAAAHPRLRLHGRWDRPWNNYLYLWGYVVFYCHTFLILLTHETFGRYVMKVQWENEFSVCAPSIYRKIDFSEILLVN